MPVREEQLLTYYLLLKATLEYLSPLLKSAKNERSFRYIHREGNKNILYL